MESFKVFLYLCRQEQGASREKNDSFGRVYAAVY